MNAALLASTTTTRATPVDVYDWLDTLFGFTIDVCATADNAKHPRFYSPHDDGLAQEWENEVAFMNPPYGRQIGPWMQKARGAAINWNSQVVALVPARVDTDWWHTTVMQTDATAGRLLRTRYVPLVRTHWYQWQRVVVGVHFMNERIPFDGLDGAPFPSAVVVFAPPGSKPEAPHLDFAKQRRPQLTLGWPH